MNKRQSVVGLIVLSKSSSPEGASVDSDTVLECNRGREFVVAKVVLVENRGEVVTAGVDRVGRLSEQLSSGLVATATTRITVNVVNRASAV